MWKKNHLNIVKGLKPRVLDMFYAFNVRFNLNFVP